MGLVSSGFPERYEWAEVLPNPPLVSRLLPGFGLPAALCGSVPGVVAVGEVCGVSPRGAARSWTAAKQDFGWVRHTAVDAMGVEVKDFDPLGFLSPRFVKSLCCFGNEIIVFTFAIFVTSLMVYHISTNFSTLALYHVLLACKKSETFCISFSSPPRSIKASSDDFCF